jgi:hypothetical protein
MDRDKMSNLYRKKNHFSVKREITLVLTIDTFCIYSKCSYLRIELQINMPLKLFTNQKQELPVAAMFVNGSGQNEQSL